MIQRFGVSQIQIFIILLLFFSKDTLKLIKSNQKQGLYFK